MRISDFLEVELLYKPLCPSAGLSGGRLIVWSVCRGAISFLGRFLAKSAGHIFMKIDSPTLLRDRSYSVLRKQRRGEEGLK